MSTDVILYPPIPGPDGAKVSRYENVASIETEHVGHAWFTFVDADGDTHHTTLPFEIIARGKKP